MTAPSPYETEGHAERATYRCEWLRITLTHGYASPSDRPWQCVRGGTVTTMAGATPIQAMRLLGRPKPEDWIYTP